MPIDLNVRNDFAAIIDGGEPITLRRRANAETIAVAKAWRYASHTDEAEPANGRVARHDVEWQFAWDDAHDLPRLGDVLIDASDRCWTILAVDELGAKTRLRCTTRNLRLVVQLEDRVDVQRAIWGEVGGQPAIVGWQTIRAALPARIQPERLTVDNDVTPANSVATYRILLGEQLTLDADCRFVDPRGGVYQLVEYIQADRIDALPVAVVIQQAAA